MNRVLTEKNVLITGGTGALGSALVRKYCAAGASVVFTYYQNESRAKELEALGARGSPLDLKDLPALEVFCRKIRSELKILHVLVHNAAVTQDATIQNLDEAGWDEVMTVNLKAPYLLTKKFLFPLFKARPGKVFFITSRAALSGIYGAANYAASKAGLVGMAKSLAQELGRKEVLVNCVNPGFMKSRMTESLPEAVRKKNLEESSLGRHSSPDEVADFLVYLSSGSMTQVTGQVFHYESRKT